MKQKQPHILTGNMVSEMCADNPRTRWLHRLHCVALVLNGSSASAVSRIFGDSPRAISYWVNRFQSRGIDGLKEEARSGRPSKLSALQLKTLNAYVKKNDDISAEELAEHIEKTYRISLTSRQCYRIIQRSQS